LDTEVLDAVLAIPHLDLLGARTIQSLHKAFANGPCLRLTQAWRVEEEPDFEPAWIRLGWRDDCLFIFAELRDRDIFNRARNLNEKTWLLGDVLEIFLQREGETGYVEFHITPENNRLQLKFPYAGGGRGSIALENPDVLFSRTWVQVETNHWYVLAEIPGSSVGGSTAPLGGETWRYSFSRYDYTRGKAYPILSSSSAHRQPMFHRIDEWGMIHFKRR
jgi:hypothetical protein